MCVGTFCTPKCLIKGYESKDSLSNFVEGQDVVPPTEDTCEYKLAKDAHVAKLVYLLKPLKDTSAELWVSDLC
jgi:hypothetical protein